MTLSKELQRAIAAHHPSPDALRDLADLHAMSVPQLAARYQELFGKPSRIRHRAYMERRCAWRLEEQRTGGLSELARRRLETLVAAIKLPIGEPARSISGHLVDPSRRELAPGSLIVKEWKGRQYQIRAMENGGFELDGTRFRSLSAIAQHVTGSHWSGPLWLGLKSRSKKT